MVIRGKSGQGEGFPALTCATAAFIAQRHPRHRELHFGATGSRTPVVTGVLKNDCANRVDGLL